MKSTLTMRSIANPQRTTLAHLSDAGELAPGERPTARTPELPRATANPRRTVLNEREDAA